jgi:hypothetical protein
MERLRMRFFLKKPDGTIAPSDLEVSWPERAAPTTPSSTTLYVAKAEFPGVMPDGGGASRRESNLHAMIEILGSVTQFCTDFEKAGGTLYFAMPDDESKPFLGEPVKAKRFFRI